MSEPLAALSLARYLIQKEITMAILRAELIKLGATDLTGRPNQIILDRRITELQTDCEDLSHRLVTEMEKL